MLSRDLVNAVVKTSTLSFCDTRSYNSNNGAAITYSFATTCYTYNISLVFTAISLVRTKWHNHNMWYYRIKSFLMHYTHTNTNRLLLNQWVIWAHLFLPLGKSQAISSQLKKNQSLDRNFVILPFRNMKHNWVNLISLDLEGEISGTRGIMKMNY